MRLDMKWRDAAVTTVQRHSRVVREKRIIQVPALESSRVQDRRLSIMSDDKEKSTMPLILARGYLSMPNPEAGMFKN